MRQLIQFISIQFKETYRQPGVLFWAFAFPVLMAWGLGIAFSNKSEIVRQVAVINNEIAIRFVFNASGLRNFSQD